VLAVNDGDVLGDVTLTADGQISGTGLGEELVAVRLARATKPAAVFAALDGWSNGYVRARLVSDGPVIVAGKTLWTGCAFCLSPKHAGPCALVAHLPGKHDQSSHGKGGGRSGGGGKPGALHDEQTIRNTFNFYDEQTGMTAEVASIRSGGPGSSTYVDVNIMDRDGNIVGQAVRTIRPPGQRTVQHDGMALHPGMQGQGFATRFNTHAEASYREHGIKQITTTANIDVGGYSHARAGYDFVNNDARAEALVHVAIQTGNYGDGIRAEVNRLIRDPGATPIEIAMIGHTPGAKTWPGKEMLLGSMWEGVKTL
jgi:GNAT superfamily N-acetyltransferase